ncbi:type 1 glutamine amidotransferase [Cellulomonas bogoriensis]|uniref:Glutamine amidotransferase n=1 Tax=Cellulomonas bogoriensis 69B4 = DSM 16987 TaxID=1386082 RepID=A0A0A0C291_9CELL|nr:type 1 glutamine amidotransferase [Cellulomonas bogoriensis]KGM14291.1 glutamine amidotransferase [Cellulomonas bogoriensis 69B4 = DSM 16987]
MRRPLLVLQHAPWEGPGLVAVAVSHHAVGVPVHTRTVLDDADAALPRASSLAGLVVMGGPMSADDDLSHPGLPAERRLLAEAVQAHVPVLGVCLGMQLLAVALGADLHHRHGTEIGFAPVDVRAPDPVLGPLGPDPTVLHWHGDAVGLPPSSTLLASTSTTPVQAFRAGSAVGLQFHVEVDEELLGTWLGEPAMTDGVDPAVVAQVRADARRTLPGLVPHALTGLAAFVEAVAARA